MGIEREIRELVERHVPELRYHPLEQYRADSAASITDSWSERGYSNSLFSSQSDQLIAAARPAGSKRRLSLELLKREGDSYYPGGPSAENDDRIEANPSTVSEDSAQMHRKDAYSDVVYCHWFPREDEPVKWLQYWFFYYFNPFRFGNHQGDWEGIRIEIGDDGKPVSAVYNRHAGEEQRK